MTSPCPSPLAVLLAAVLLAPAADAAEATFPPEPGPFARLLSERDFVGPGIRPQPPGPDGSSPSEAAKDAGKYVLPADFEPAGAVVMAGRLARDLPELFAEVVANVRQHDGMVCLVPTAAERTTVAGVIAARGLPAGCVSFVEIPTDTVWVRDFGPVFVKRDDGAWRALDLEYCRRDDGRQRPKDRRAAAALARHFKVPLTHVPLELEGGDLLSNGRGLCVTSTVAFNRNISRGIDEAAVTSCFRDRLGSRQIVLLEPLRGEPTGHVDTFACFTDPRTIVVGRYPPSVDPANAAILDRNAALLAKVRTAEGKLRVVRVRMPGNEDGVWRTYTNGIFALGVLLVPNYAGTDPDAQREAMATFGRLLPGRKVLGIEAGKLAAWEGALRCVTARLPPGLLRPARDANKDAPAGASSARSP